MNKRVAVFGDSISKGIVTSGNKLHRIDANAVSLIADEYGYEVVDFSRYGQTLKRICERNLIEKFIEGADGSGEEYAVFCIGGNDADYDWRAVSQSPGEDHHPFTQPEEFAKLLDDGVDKLLHAGVKVILTILPPVDSKRYFDNVICNIADGERVLEFFGGDVTNIARSQEVYNYAIIRCAHEHSCPIIDLRTGFLLDRRYLDKYCADGAHPNEEGHRFMAEQVVKSLARQGIVLHKS